MTLLERLVSRDPRTTLLQRLVPMPMSLSRVPRARLEQLLDELYEDRDRAEAAQRADRDRIAALIECAADAHARDAEHLDRLTGTVRGAAVEKLTAGGHRAVECALRDVARDVAGER